MFQPKNIINKPKKWIGECSRRKGKGYHRVSADRVKAAVDVGF
jgi:hypothetical protein